MRWITDERSGEHFAVANYRVQLGKLTFEDLKGAEHSIPVPKALIGDVIEPEAAEERDADNVHMESRRPARLPAEAESSSGIEPTTEAGDSRESASPSHPTSDKTWRNRRYDLPAIARASGKVSYRARFEAVAENGDGSAVWSSVIKTLYRWLEEKEARRAQQGEDSLAAAMVADDLQLEEQVGRTDPEPGPIVPGPFANGGFASECSESFLRTDAESGPIADAFPRFWAMEYVERDEKSGFRFRITDVGITAVEPGKLAINMRTRYYDDPTYIYDASEPDRMAPGFIEELFKTESCKIASGDVRMSSGALPITAENLDEFVADLVNPRRTIPIAVVSSREADDGTESYPVEPRWLAGVLRGVAVVRTLDLNNDGLKEAYARLFGNPELPSFKYRLVPGVLRIFWSRVDLEHPAEYDYARHRFFTEEALEDRGVESVVRQISKGISRLPLHRDGEVCDVREVESKRFRRRVEDMAAERILLRERIKEAESERDKAGAELRESGNWKAYSENLEAMILEKNELIDAYESEIEALSESDAGQSEINRLKEELHSVYDECDKAEKRAEELENEKGKLSYRNKELGEEVDRLRSADVAYKKQADLLLDFGSSLTDAGAVVTLAAKAFDDRIIILEEAKRSAIEFDGDAGEMFEALKAMYTVLWEMRFGKGGAEIVSEDDFRARTGFEIAFHESKMTNRDTKFKRLRERTYEGETIDITPHVKGRKKSVHLRVHFCFDKERRLIVVGHCGEHLKTYGTHRQK